ncbi:glycosyltransferase [Jiangella alkaliphila]|uniref:Glycosyltransferase involved in cell wall bisynthesis n=1 Tax=Jiangella alkaliphila TaxID=419479 RepID=A0A1H2M0J1_9ACTN|nr:glycosyltransferase [Jiangella alkaliphila]SDU86757.1 Glycosyltransferase involved in cell wall bisynthesis [Jiangella alkaliphila]
MKVLMLVQSPVAGDSRVLREAATLTAEGHSVHIVGRDVPDGFDPGDDVTVESVTRSRGMRPPGTPRGVGVALASSSGPKALVRRAGRWLLLPEHRERTERRWRDDAARLLAGRPAHDVVHAHDFNTLALGADLARQWSAKLVYDSHELWFDRGLPGRPTPLARWRGRRSETRLAGQARVVLTVSEGIAARLRGRGLPDVRVVRNTFPLAEHEPPELPDQPAGFAYAGRIGPGRDLEAVVGAAARLPSLRTVVAGPADPGYRLDTTGVEVLPPMPLPEVDRLYQEVGVAVVTLTDTCANHRLALPNKLFHAVRAGVPVVAANLPELHAFVLRYGLGRLYVPGDASSLATAVEAVASGYTGYVEAVGKARLQLAWEHDSRVLAGVYADLGTA